VVRRALAMAAGEQYLRLAIQFGSIVVVSRLLTPAEIGVSVIGMGIMATVLGMREFATSDCLIQREEVTRDDIRTSFTILLLLTALLATAVFIAAPWFGTFYGEEQLARFLRVVAVAGLIEAISLPIRGLLRRDMAFGALAFINTASAGVTAIATVVLAFAGFGYMSVAWATMAAAVTTAVLSCCCRSDLSIFCPAFKSWRSVLTFGGYNGASYAIGHAYETIPQLVLGGMLPPSAVGLYNRAAMVSKIPQMIFLTSVFAVAFPALAAEMRRGRSLKEPYLQGLTLITVFYWPALALVALLAHPIVSLLLGQQWLGVVPLLQIMAIAYLAWFPDPLTTPVFLAVGANRDRALVLFLGYGVSAAVLCSAAYFGIMAMAASKLLTMPYMMVLALYFVRRHLAFSWDEVWAALWKSAIATAGTAAGPLCVMALSGGRLDLSITATAAAILLAASGWLLSVLLTRHLVVLELRRAAESVVRRLRDHIVPVGGLQGRR
jgi:O-antigen/teichoic acid export membrane protein